MPRFDFAKSLTFNAEPGPVPQLRIGATVSILDVDRPTTGGSYNFWGSATQLFLGNVRFPVWVDDDRAMPGISIENIGSVQVLARAPMYRHLVDAVESTRVDNVAVQLSYSAVVSQPGGRPQRLFDSISYTLPESEWVKLLRELGLRAGWTAHIERGTIEGWDIVATHIESAHQKLVGHDPKGVLAAAREAIRAAKPLFEGNWAEVAAQIDLGRPTTSAQPPKSERIKAGLDATLYFVDASSHEEDHGPPSMYDAEVGYGMTVDLLAYLSRAQAAAHRRRAEVTGKRTP